MRRLAHARKQLEVEDEQESNMATASEISRVHCQAGLSGIPPRVTGARGRGQSRTEAVIVA